MFLTKKFSPFITILVNHVRANSDLEAVDEDVVEDDVVEVDELDVPACKLVLHQVQVRLDALDDRKKAIV
jgi:hypothetical protein